MFNKRELTQLPLDFGLVFVIYAHYRTGCGRRLPDVGITLLRVVA